jgi:hypothetical protein
LHVVPSPHTVPSDHFAAVGGEVGTREGLAVETFVGAPVGGEVGAGDGWIVGLRVGLRAGFLRGARVGGMYGRVGLTVGEPVGVVVVVVVMEGAALGTTDGVALGVVVGEEVGAIVDAPVGTIVARTFPGSDDGFSAGPRPPSGASASVPSMCEGDKVPRRRFCCSFCAPTRRVAIIRMAIAGIEMDEIFMAVVGVEVRSTIATKFDFMNSWRIDLPF